MEVHDTIVVGGGAGGLAVGRELQRQGRSFIIVDAADRVGDSWRSRYDSLRLFTPAAFCALPDLDMPLDGRVHPGKHQIADYLESYSSTFGLPVLLGQQVLAHRWTGRRHRLSLRAGPVEARTLIVAGGALRRPVVPAFARQLSGDVRQIHSARYRNPHDLQPGTVLVVGAGTAGADISQDIAGGRPVTLAGPRVGHVPISLVRSRWFRTLAYGHKIPPGRIGDAAVVRLRRRSSPLIWQRERDLIRAGITRVGRIVGVRRGQPVLADGRAIEAANVVWCTGLRPDFAWLDSRALDRLGYPAQRRGVSRNLPRLGFVGLPYQYTFRSGFLAGMADDAGYVTRQLA